MKLYEIIGYLFAGFVIANIWVSIISGCQSQTVTPVTLFPSCEYDQVFVPKGTRVGNNKLENDAVLVTPEYLYRLQQLERGVEIK